MNMKQIIEAADKRGYTVAIDKTGPKYLYRITDRNYADNPPIETDRRGIELFLSDIDGYLNYCETADIEPF